MSGTGSGSGRHAAPENGGGGRRSGPLVAAAVVLVAVVAAAVTGWPVSMPWSDDDSGTSAQPGSASSTSEASPSTDPSPSAGADTSAGSGADTASWLRTCATRVAGEEKVVEAAADGVRHWHGHVQARTDMFAGRISQDQMHQIWSRTKLAGPEDQQRFEAAIEKHPASSPCSKPTDVPSDVRAAADDCRKRSEVAARGVEAAHAAMHDWENHLANMARYADGGMSQTMAQDKWVTAWRNAPAHISAYDAARDALREAPACEAQSG